MKNILLNDGNTVLIASNSDALEVIEESLSYELATYFRSVLYNMDATDKEIDYLERENARLEDENDELENEVENLEREIKSLESELEKLKNGSEDNDNSLPFY